MITFDPASGCLLFAFNGAHVPQPITGQRIDLHATPNGFHRWAMAATGRLATTKEWQEWLTFLASEVADQMRWWEWSKVLRCAKAANGSTALTLVIDGVDAGTVFRPGGEKP